MGLVKEDIFKSLAMHLACSLGNTKVKKKNNNHGPLYLVYFKICSKFSCCPYYTCFTAEKNNLSD
jgi:hypothetical protein